MTEWVTRSVADVAFINREQISKDYPHNRIKYIDVASTEEGRVVEVQDLELDKAPSRAKRIVKKNDFIISSVRPNLKHYAFLKEVEENYIVSTGYVVISAKENTDPRFLYYLLTTPEYTDYLTRVADGHTSTYPSFNPSVISESQIKIPKSLQQQKSISAVLASLDDKIELNEKTNRALEQAVHTLFKEHFESPQKQDTFQKCKVSDFIQVKHGYAFKGDSISEDETPNILVTPGNFRIGGGFKGSKFKYYNADIPSEYILKNSDIVITMTDLSKEGDTLGYPAITPKDPYHNFLHNQRIGLVQFSNEKIKYWIYNLLLTQKYRAWILGSATGSTVKHTSPSRILEYEFLAPSKSEMQTFSEKVAPYYALIQNNFTESIYIEKLRNSLLPKLIAGEIDLKEVSI